MLFHCCFCLVEGRCKFLILWTRLFCRVWIYICAVRFCRVWIYLCCDTFHFCCSDGDWQTDRVKKEREKVTGVSLLVNVCQPDLRCMLPMVSQHWAWLGIRLQIQLFHLPLHLIMDIYRSTEILVIITFVQNIWWVCQWWDLGAEGSGAWGRSWRSQQIHWHAVLHSWLQSTFQTLWSYQWSLVREKPDTLEGLFCGSERRWMKGSERMTKVPWVRKFNKLECVNDDM